ncbi:MAG: NFACT RNA binding domain-containing protein [Bacteroidota bacterium]|nr:NFACT RNA binding domain-containing protein [Bacteroidota bacterium]MDW8138331.1 NFACT RNA binding domain-containing protein [Bacteroidota bacterium]
MHASYFTLRAWIQELRPLLSGALLEEAFTQESEELRLIWALSDGGTLTLRFCLHPARLYAAPRWGRDRRRRNVKGFFQSLWGLSLSELFIAERDRLLHFVFDTPQGPLRLHVHLYRQNGNVFLEQEGIVQEAFLQTELWRARPWPGAKPASDPQTYEAFASAFCAEPGEAQRAFQRAVPLADRLIAKEALWRAGVDPEQIRPEADESVRRIWLAWCALRESWRFPEPRIYAHATGPYFALGPMRHLEAQGAHPEPFDSVGTALQAFAGRFWERLAFQGLFSELEARLARELSRLQAAEEALTRELGEPDRSARYAQWGHLLLIHAQALPRGLEEAELEDLFSGGRTRIPLDPQLSASENAQRYYEKARRAQEARLQAEKRLLAVRARRATLQEAQLALRRCRTVRDLKRWIRAHAEREEGSAKALPFRRIPLGEGYEAWVGRSAKQNELLLNRYARPHDLWLHVQGLSGAHVIVKRTQAQKAPPHKIIQAAAEIAAYFSQARKAERVPVWVAERRHVRKPKGALPGHVLLERGQTVFVKPRPPEP